MKVLLTGAAGFIGRAVAKRLADDPSIDAVRLLDRVPTPQPPDRRFEVRITDLTSEREVTAALDDIDTVIHLASVPGGTAEGDPALSRKVNLDATLLLLEVLDARSTVSRFVYASSIAVFGRLTDPVVDNTLPQPKLVYGVHKRMAELALADFHRRGRVSAIALRLPGIVPRPPGDKGLRSAFMSDIFHAARAGEPFEMPVAPEATVWIMSVSRVAENLLHAAKLEQVDGSALTLPALRITAAELAAALYANSDRVSYCPDPLIQGDFGAFPPLATPAAVALGFRHDESLKQLVRRAE